MSDARFTNARCPHPRASSQLAHARVSPGAASPASPSPPPPTISRSAASALFTASASLIALHARRLRLLPPPLQPLSLPLLRASRLVLPVRAGPFLDERSLLPGAPPFGFPCGLHGVVVHVAAAGGSLVASASDASAASVEPPRGEPAAESRPRRAPRANARPRRSATERSVAAAVLGLSEATAVDASSAAARPRSARDGRQPPPDAVHVPRDPGAIGSARYARRLTGHHCDVPGLQDR